MVRPTGPSSPGLAESRRVAGGSVDGSVQPRVGSVRPVQTRDSARLGDSANPGPVQPEPSRPSRASERPRLGPDPVSAGRYVNAKVGGGRRRRSCRAAVGRIRSDVQHPPALGGAGGVHEPAPERRVEPSGCACGPGGPAAAGCAARLARNESMAGRPRRPSLRSPSESLQGYPRRHNGAEPNLTLICISSIAGAVCPWAGSTSCREECSLIGWGGVGGSMDREESGYNYFAIVVECHLRADVILYDGFEAERAKTIVYLALEFVKSSEFSVCATEQGRLE